MHTTPLHTTPQRLFARQFGQHTMDTAYREAMDLGDYERAEEMVRRHPNAWTRSTRLSFIRNRQGDLGTAIDLINVAEDEVSTKEERAGHLANMAHYSILLGDLREAIGYGVNAVLLDQNVVMGGVNAVCAASMLRSRRDLAAVLRLLNEKAPSVLVNPHWFERWQNDPQLAFARLVVAAPSPILH